MVITRGGKKVKTNISIHIYDRFWLRFKGLMFRKEPLLNEGVLLVPCNSIHMFGMFISIDVVFLDELNKVTKCYSKVKPNQWIPPSRISKKVLELPLGTIEKYEVQIGDIISF